MRVPRPRLSSDTAAFVSVAFVAFLAWAFLWPASKTFTPEGWKAARAVGKTGSDVEEMAESLVDSGILIGKTRSEVTALLSLEGKDAEFQDFGLYLEVILDEGFDTWTVLDVSFDGEGRVHRAAVNTKGT